MEKDLAWLKEHRVAHRGLHDNKIYPENSLKAYKNAVDHGYDIEMDVWLTKSNVLIMHHDPSLKRTTGQDIKAVDIDTNNLEQYKLFGTEEHVPLFDDMLKTVDGKVGLIIEIKPTKRVRETCEMVMDHLKGYKGKYCIESFDWNVVNYMHKHYPDVILGQLYDYIWWQRIPAILMKQYKKVNFLAICIKNGASKYYAKIRAKYKDKVIVSWTIRTPEQQALALKTCDNYIFEADIKKEGNISLPNPNIKDDKN